MLAVAVERWSKMSALWLNKTLLRQHLYHRDRNYDLFQCTSASSSTKTKKEGTDKTIHLFADW